jgi:hypothetical protein
MHGRVALQSGFWFCFPAVAESSNEDPSLVMIWGLLGRMAGCFPDTLEDASIS